LKPVHRLVVVTGEVVGEGKVLRIQYHEVMRGETGGLIRRLLLWHELRIPTTTADERSHRHLDEILHHRDGMSVQHMVGGSIRRCRDGAIGSGNEIGVLLEGVVMVIRMGGGKGIGI